MRLPTKARPRLQLYTMMVIGGLLFTACSNDVVAPSAKPLDRASQERTSPFVPTDAQRALVGVADGTYSITFDPSRDQRFTLGPNYLSIPSNSVCEMDGSSGYGSAFWNQSCAPETDSVTISVTIEDSQSDHPRIDFFPAMRFNPVKNVMLYFYVPVGTDDFARNWIMQYCAENNTCVNEALADDELQTYIDRSTDVVFRRIKHFSGYIIWGAVDETISSLFSR